jgi:hypothetical protein
MQAMAVVCAFTFTSAVPMFWALFYFGASELSTVPLALNEHYGVAYDLLSDEAGAEPSEAVSERLARLQARRDMAQAWAAALFVAVRGIAFPLVSLRGVGPDVLSVVRSGAAAAMGGLVGTSPPRLLANWYATLAFSALQLYWLGCLIHFTLKSGLGGTRPE